MKLFSLIIKSIEYSFSDVSKTIFISENVRLASSLWELCHQIDNLINILIPNNNICKSRCKSHGKSSFKPVIIIKYNMFWKNIWKSILFAYKRFKFYAQFWLSVVFLPRAFNVINLSMLQEKHTQMS